MKIFKILLVLFFFSSVGKAQQLNFQVIINSDRSRIQNTDVFNQMKSSFEQFLNGRSWTTDEFRPEERIRGNLLITNFEYIESQPLEFNRFTFLNNISSLLAFYANIALGIDYDSFGSKGGNPFFEVANDIVNNAQQSGRPGWVQNPNDRRSRYWLINDIYVSSVFAPIREAYYLYHRQGLDLLLTDQETAFKNILESIRLVAEANKTQPNGILTISFMDAKGDEIPQILKNAPFEIREEAVKLLLEVDPNNARKYNELLRS
ncbi:MAG: DUF4835 domain-containing protein [Algoriphagus sp. 32-45-6]|nr:MAG: DUF4835 domain-containing protein [Algoriphagus sp. 32-45-6]